MYRLLVVWAALVLLVGGGQLVAGVAQQHPGQYAQADIEYGSHLYSAQCSTCHGPAGDAVAGVDLRSGKFRNVSSDRFAATISPIIADTAAVSVGYRESA